MVLIYFFFPPLIVCARSKSFYVSIQSPKSGRGMYIRSKYAPVTGGIRSWLQLKRAWVLLSLGPAHLTAACPPRRSEEEPLPLKHTSKTPLPEAQAQLTTTESLFAELSSAKSPPARHPVVLQRDQHRAASTRFAPKRQPVSSATADLQRRDVILAGLEHGCKQTSAFTRHRRKGDGAEMTSNRGVFPQTPYLRIYKTHRLTRTLTGCLLTLPATDTGNQQEEPELTVVGTDETGPSPDL